LRGLSREQYLEKREEQRLLLLKKKIQDEEELFANEKLSKAERKRFEYEKELLRIAEERMKINDKVDGYMVCGCIP
jgi:pre-mRNA-splicing factor ATP-dependent RNA helicase DHX16